MLKNLNTMISIVFLVGFVVIGGLYLGNDESWIRSALEFVTFLVLPWIFLYWFIRFVKAYESRK